MAVQMTAVLTAWMSSMQAHTALPHLVVAAAGAAADGADVLQHLPHEPLHHKSDDGQGLVDTDAELRLPAHGAGQRGVHVQPIMVADMLGGPAPETETTFVQNFLHEVSITLLSHLAATRLSMAFSAQIRKPLMGVRYMS